MRDDVGDRQRAAGSVVDARRTPRSGFGEAIDAAVDQAGVELRRRRERDRRDVAGERVRRVVVGNRLPRRAERRAQIRLVGAKRDHVGIRRRTGLRRAGNRRRHHAAGPRIARRRHGAERVTAVGGALHAAVLENDDLVRVVPVDDARTAVRLDHQFPRFFARVPHGAVVLGAAKDHCRLRGMLAEIVHRQGAQTGIARDERRGSSASRRIRREEHAAVAAEPQRVGVARRVHEVVNVAVHRAADVRQRDRVCAAARRYGAAVQRRGPFAAEERAARTDVHRARVVGVDGERARIPGLTAQGGAQRTADGFPRAAAAVEPEEPQGVRAARIGHERVQHARIGRAHGERDAPVAGRRKARADRRPDVAVRRAEHVAAPLGGEERRHAARARDDDVRVHAGTFANPVELPGVGRVGLAAIEPDGRRADDVVAVARIDSELEERFARERSRAGGNVLEEPGGTAVVAANRPDAAVRGQKAREPLSEERVRVAFAGADVDACRRRGVDRDRAARQARRRERERIDVEGIFVRLPRRAGIVGSPHAAQSRRDVHGATARRHGDPRDASADAGTAVRLPFARDRRPDRDPVALTGNSRATGSRRDARSARLAGVPLGQHARLAVHRAPVVELAQGVEPERARERRDCFAAAPLRLQVQLDVRGGRVEPDGFTFAQHARRAHL